MELAEPMCSAELRFEKLTYTYFVVHPVENVWHGRNHGGLEQPDVVVEQAHVPGVETD